MPLIPLDFDIKNNSWNDARNEQTGPVNDPLTLEEKHAVAACVRESIAAGAIGFSASRFTGHRDETGNLMPGSLADVDGK